MTIAKAYRAGFASMQSIVSKVSANDRLEIFGNQAREAASWTKKKDGPTKGEVVDRLREIAIGTGLIGERSEDDVQAAMTVAFETLDTPKGPPPRFKLLPFENLVVGTSRRYLVKGLLTSTGLALIWGPPKCGKSFLTFDLLMHVALDWNYRGRRVQSGPVVYLALEGAEGFKARAEAFRSHHKIEIERKVPFYLIATPVNLVADHQSLVDSIRQQLGEVRPVAIAVDTLNRSLPGSESKDEDMAAYVRAADAIRDAFHCVVVIVHHSGIAPGRPRGHTSLTGAADTQIKVERDAGGNIIMTLEWQKDGPEGALIVSRLESIEVGTDVDGDLITSCVIVPVEGTPAKLATRPKLTKGAQIALKGLNEAIAECGEPAPASNHIPAKAKVTTFDLWRTYAYRLGLSDSDKPRARQMAFQRASEALITAGLIGVWQPHVWSAGEAYR